MNKKGAYIVLTLLILVAMVMGFFIGSKLTNHQSIRNHPSFTNTESSLTSSSLTVFWTVLAGVLVYVLGQLLSKFLIDPLNEQRKLMGEIADSLIFHANVYCNPGTVKQEMMDNASSQFRRQATQLRSKAYLIPSYDLLSRFKIVVARKDLEHASTELIGLSNSVYRPSGHGERNLGIQNSDRADTIAKLLDLKIKIN